MRPISREKVKSRPLETESTEAGHRDGRTCSSGEGLVTSLERRGPIVLLEFIVNPRGEERMKTAKPFDIAKRLVWEAYQKVKANGGAAGVDEQSLDEFEGALKNNLYRIWNRMSSGSYFPPPVKAVAVRHHTKCKWVLLYIERWLTAPMQAEDGRLRRRDKGTPQGGVVSPLLAKLFLHYAFDRWMATQFPRIPFCRYADDGLIHCRSLKQARYLHDRLAQRLKECGLELHPEKTKVVYCRDLHRRREYERIQFDFLGYTFRPRRSKDRYGRIFVNFTPAISREAGKAIRQTVRSWRLQLKSDKSIEDLAHMFGPEIRGWMNYYCRFCPSAFRPTANHLNKALARWAMRKHKRLRGHPRRATHWVGRIARRQPGLFPHWRFGFMPIGWNDGSRMS